MTRIVDQWGNPLEIPVEQESQTSRLGWINHTWAEHPVSGLTPAALALLLRDAEQGDIRSQADLFNDVEERWAHLYAEMSKRRRAVTRLDWDLIPPPNANAQEQQDTEWLRELCVSIEELPQLLYDLTDAIGKGFSCVEIEWRRRIDGVWMPRAFHHREQRLFRFTRVGGLTDEIRLADLTALGQPLRPLSWITHVSRARSVSGARAALFRTLVWPFLYQAFSLGDWAEFLEVYGYPIRIGKYSASAKKEERDTLLRAVVEVGRRAGGIIPDTMQLDLLDAVDGEPAAFADLVAWAERSASKAILGGTLTSQADGKSSTNALGRVHDEVRQDLRDDDAIALAGTLTRDLVLAIGVVNGRINDPLRAPRWKFQTQDPEDVEVYAKALPELAAAGFEIDIEWAHARLGIPMATTPKRVRGPTGDLPPLGAPNPAPRVQIAASKIAGGVFDDETGSGGDDKPGELANQLAIAAEAPLGDLIRGIREMVERAASLEQLRDQMLSAYSALDTERLAQVMQVGFSLAALQGVADVMEE